jgi:hypothetical protein
MTNLLAYEATYKNPNGESAERLTLTINSIDPDGVDDNELSVAYAITDRITASDFSQGSTSETLSVDARTILVNKANAIFLKYEVVNPLGQHNSEIDGKVW